MLPFQRIADNYGSIEQVQEALRRQGLESSNLICAVDFTKSNEWTGRDSFGRKSLHHIGATPNPYEEAITIIGKTLRSFDDDGLIQAYGFGDATTGDRQVFSFLPKDEPCIGLEGVVCRYRELVPHVRLAGPTSFAPAIRQAMDVVAASGGQYHILLLIADGQVTRGSDLPANERSVQEQDTVDAIVEASNYPLSIILVGVGDGPWGLMYEFDDRLPQRTFDNFQFLDYTSLALTTPPQQREATFALHALMEIPDQYRAIQRLRLLNKAFPRQRVAARNPPGPPPSTAPPPPPALHYDSLTPPHPYTSLAPPPPHAYLPTPPPHSYLPTLSPHSYLTPPPPAHHYTSLPPPPPVPQLPPSPLPRTRGAPAAAASRARSPPNPMFVCPITQEVMADPVIAADGHSYERHAIEQWLASHNTSPLTNSRMPNRQLIPNHSLRSAILEAHPKLARR